MINIKCPNCFKLAGIIVLIATFINGYAQSNDLLTIQDAVKMCYTRNAELQQMYAQLKQKKVEWRMETGISAPEISYFKEGIGNGPSDAFDEKRISISQEFDFPLTVSYRLKKILEETKALEYKIIAREREIKSEVKSHYIEVLYALHLQKLRENQLKLSQELYNAVFTKFETGMASGIDLVNAELKLDEAKNDFDQVEWTLHMARYSLFYSMGLPVEEQRYTITFTDTLHAPDIEIAQIFALAKLEEQPEYQSSVHKMNATGLLKKEAQSNIFPDIRFNLYRQNFGGGFNFRGFEVGLAIPLWLPLDQRGKIKTAVAMQEELSWKQKEIGLDMKKQIEYAWHNYSVSRSIVRRYNQNMKQKASQLQSMTIKAYKLGEADLLTLLNAQQTYLISEQRFLSSLRDYYLQLAILEKFLDKDLVY